MATHDSIAYPSSPPSLPDDVFGEIPPSSPPLPTVTHTRKRARVEDIQHAYDSSNSSDPAIFSDDGIDHSLSNYSEPRRKRKIVGTWWDHVKVADREKGEIKRNVDSGVWMESESSGDGEYVSSERTVRFCTPRHDGNGGAMQASPISLRARKQAANARVDTEIQARRIVSDCLDDGNEVVDLINLGLRTLHDDTLHPLHALIRYPHADDEVPSSDAYQSFTPELRIFLAKNRLREVPRELWTLENTTVLSLRDNEIGALSPDVANLRRLMELNLSINNLRWLPYELLRLVGRDGSLQRLTTSSNPFIQGLQWLPETLAFLDSQPPGGLVNGPGIKAQIRRLETLIASHTSSPVLNELNILLRLHRALHTSMMANSSSGYHSLSALNATHHERYPWKRDPIYIASTPVSYFDRHGALCPFSPSSPCTVPTSTTYIQAIPETPASPPKAEDITHVPSLSETCLRNLARLPTPQISLLPTYLTDDHIPRHTRDAVAALVQTVGISPSSTSHSGYGSLPACSVCVKKYVMQRAEWIEFWHYLPDAPRCAALEMFLPFLRRACSWACVAQVFRDRVVGEGDS